MNKTVKILCVHQGYELYGSDRVFIQSVKAFYQHLKNVEITVHLPKLGALSEKLSPYAEKICTKPLWVIRLSKVKSIRLKDIIHFIKSWKEAFCHLKQNDIVYISTGMVWGYIFLAPFFKTRCYIHLHEFAIGIPKIVLTFLLWFSRATIIVNSYAMKNHYQGVLSPIVVLNGVPYVTKKEKIFSCDALNILLIGRINAMKGHKILIEAVASLSEDKRKKIIIRFVGDVFDDQNHYKNELHDLVKNRGLENQIHFIGFDDNPDSHYEWADLCVVPSTKPESFGLVAVEAMAHSLPVIASNHGGLKDIILDTETGFLIEPGNTQELSDRLSHYFQEKHLLKEQGDAGYQRFVAYFTEERYSTECATLIAETIHA